MDLERELVDYLLENLRKGDSINSDLFSESNKKMVCFFYGRESLSNEQLGMALNELVLNSAKKVYKGMVRRHVDAESLGEKEFFAYVLNHREVFSKKELRKIGLHTEQAVQDYVERHYRKGYLKRLKFKFFE